MAFMDRRRSTLFTEPEAPAPAETNAPGRSVTAFIDENSEFQGKLRFKDSVQIDGRVEGEISCEQTLTIGAPGRIEASIESKCVVVAGDVKGDIVAHDHVTLHKTAKVLGNITAKHLAIEQGAELRGQVVTGGGSAGAPKKLPARPDKPSGDQTGSR